MIVFETTILKFGQMGEKTGWTYIIVPHDLAAQLSPGNKKSFRVKGSIDQMKIKQVALLPMGDGNFILPLNAGMRKLIKKNKGAMVKVSLLTDESPLVYNEAFMACLEEEPEARLFFESLPKSHQNYFSKWIDSAKTDATKAKRIGQALIAFEHKMGFSEMMQVHKRNRMA